MELVEYCHLSHTSLIHNQADRCAAQLAGTDNAAAALINVAVKAHFLEDAFWTDIQQQVKHQADPPNNVYSSMLVALHRPMAEEQTKQWLEQTLAQKTNNTDTHPCLADRLQSLGYSVAQTEARSQPTTIQVSAAEHLLGAALQQFTAQFNQDWQTAAATPWRQRYAYFQETQSNLQTLTQKAQIQTLTAQEAWEQAYYTIELSGVQGALPLVEDVLKKHPDHAEANYTMGQFLLQKADSAGIAYIETAIAKRLDWVMEGCELAYSFWQQQGQPETAQSYRERAEQHYQLLLKAQQERATVSDRDTFQPHTLKSSEVAALTQQLANYSQVKEAYLVEKIVTHFPEERFCILGIIRKQNFIDNETAVQKLINLLATDLQFPTQAYIVILNHSSSGKLKQKIGQIDQSLIFRH